MTVLSLVIIFSSILAIMAIDIPGVQVGANLQARGYVAGVLSMIAAGSLLPTATLSVVTKVGIPLQQTTTSWESWRTITSKRNIESNKHSLHWNRFSHQ